MLRKLLAFACARAGPHRSRNKTFTPMALTVIIALVGAFILSLTFVPAMLAIWLSKAVEEKENRSGQSRRLPVRECASDDAKGQHGVSHFLESPDVRALDVVDITPALVSVGNAARMDAPHDFLQQLLEFFFLERPPGGILAHFQT